VARWRKAERERLLDARLKMPLPHRQAAAEAIASALEHLISLTAGTLVSAYWPIRGEPDLRPWMRRAHARGTRIALPVALASGRPLVFREWRPDGPLARGLWNIPYPADGSEVRPMVILAPVVGFDPDCYRLGYGGGFFDRTLAQVSHDPLIIGIGFPEASIPTIFPQAHDVPMDFIVTGTAAPIQCRVAFPRRPARRTTRGETSSL